MSTGVATPEDYKFFDFLAPYTWPHLSSEEIALLRSQVADGIIQIETVLENALARTSGGLYTRVAEVARDFCDGSDSKKAVSQFRNNVIGDPSVGKPCQWNNTISISGLKNKVGPIRALCYSKHSDEFYFFAIPLREFRGRDRIEVSLDHSTGYKCVPKGIPKGKWTQWKLESFTQLATITAEQIEKL